MSPENKQQDDREDREPVGQINYLNVVANSIQRINEACLRGENPRDAAENLITDLPDEWGGKIKDRLDVAEEEYNKILIEQQRKLQHGTPQSQKQKASADILNAEKDYSRQIKKAVITLFNEMGLLVQTRKQVAMGGYLDLYKEFGVELEKDDD